jgi:hypothetical protein
MVKTETVGLGLESDEANLAVMPVRWDSNDLGTEPKQQISFTHSWTWAI